jgi:putative ABC transport system permease protein
MRVNGQPVSSQDYAEPRAQRLIEREFNLSSRDDLPLGNAVSGGMWHAPGSAPQFSVEKGLAETLKLQLGDELEFNIAGQPFSAAITSLRTLEWDSMRVNFFVIAPAGTMDQQPTSFITSFHLPAAEVSLVNSLIRQFPNITVIDVAAVINQLQATLDQVARAVQLVFGFSLLAGLVVLLAALQASAAERSHTLAVMRALGGQQRELRKALLLEFALLGALAGTLAGIAASAIAAGLARWVFQLDYSPSASIALLASLFGACGVALAGLLATRKALTGKVLDGLREA